MLIDTSFFFSYFPFHWSPFPPPLSSFSSLPLLSSLFFPPSTSLPLLSSLFLPPSPPKSSFYFSDSKNAIIAMLIDLDVHASTSFCQIVSFQIERESIDKCFFHSGRFPQENGNKEILLNLSSKD